MDKLKTGVKRQKNACLTSALFIGFCVIFWMPRCDTPTAQYEINIGLLIVKVVAVIPLYYSYQRKLAEVNKKIDFIKEELNDYFYKVVNNEK